MAGSREYPPRPIVGVGGLIFEGDSVLLVKRGNPPGRGLWSIPGGAVRTGESLAEALKREMDEEVGLAVSVGPLVEVVERVIPDDDGRVRYHYVILDYLCFAEPGPARPGSDADDARFLPPGEWSRFGLSAHAVQVFEKAKRLRDSG